MTDAQWQAFFVAAADVLGAGHPIAKFSKSWCAWTTFDRLQSDAGYWTGGVPGHGDISMNGIGDGGAWSQPFLYSGLAHVVVPCQFDWEDTPGPNWTMGTRHQNLEALSLRLTELGVPHRATELVLEVKCY